MLSLARWTPLLCLLFCSCARASAPTATAPAASAEHDAGQSDDGALIRELSEPRAEPGGPPEDMDCPPKADAREHCVELRVRAPSPARTQALAQRLRRGGFPFSAEDGTVTGYLDASAIERLFRAPPSYSVSMASATNTWICQLVIQGTLPDEYARDVDAAMADDPACEF